jgi:hypothetical protein
MPVTSRITVPHPLLLLGIKSAELIDGYGILIGMQSAEECDGICLPHPQKVIATRMKEAK